MDKPVNIIKRFYSLDVLRGFAALSVVFWHWQHFFYTGTKLGDFNVLNLPLSKYLMILYSNGWLAVDLFFLISGFIFYWLYSNRIADKKVTSYSFFILRFSRLYPLHLLTLLFVAACQILFFQLNGNYFVYPHNDITHFILNLFFASSWISDIGYSFNGPVWSVSLEIFLYLLFFILCKLFPVRLVVLATISAIGFYLETKYHLLIGRAIGPYFLGGCLYMIYAFLNRHARYHAFFTYSLVSLMVLAWTTTYLISLYNIDLATLSIRTIPYISNYDTLFHRVVLRITDLWAILFLFPLTILALAVAETYRGTLGARMAFIGDISYSTYLLHFPLQIIFYSIITWLNFGVSTYYSSFFMVIFFTALISISLLSYNYLEKPAQNYIRKLLKK